MNHLILDFETLGTDLINGFALLECSYASFDFERFHTNPYSFDELVEEVIQRDKFEISHQVNEYGYKIEQGVLDWWKSQDKTLVEKILKPTKKDITIKEFGLKFLDYVKKNNISYWWSRSNTFDPIILYRIFNDINLRYELDGTLKHWNVRDTRTFIDAKLDFNKEMNSFVLPEWQKKFEKHNSVHDIAIDILRLQALIMAENE